MRGDNALNQLGNDPNVLRSNGAQRRHDKLPKGYAFRDSPARHVNAAPYDLSKGAGVRDKLLHVRRWPRGPHRRSIFQQVQIPELVSRCPTEQTSRRPEEHSIDDDLPKQQRSNLIKTTFAGAATCTRCKPPKLQPSLLSSAQHYVDPTAAVCRGGHAKQALPGSFQSCCRVQLHKEGELHKVPAHDLLNLWPAHTAQQEETVTSHHALQLFCLTGGLAKRQLPELGASFGPPE
mmetsp:Transcript_1416/g.3057  ORF Transcript_1416/g.3057 Transcript_1416/m.3057 type:complete len:234 (-) Transcript_1416:1549-2250(-)